MAVQLEEKISKRSDLVLQLVRRWGGAASDAILDPLNLIFMHPEEKGLIAYRVEEGCAVVFGEPVSAPNDRETLIKEFRTYCKKQEWNIIYIAASASFATWAKNNGCRVCIQFGEELTLDPHEDPRDKTGTHASLVRRKVKHAIKEGVTISEYDAANSDSALEKAVEELGERWLQNRRGPQVHISHVHLFQNRLGKRWFYAKKGDAVIGVVVLNELQAHQGWLLNHLMIVPEAAHGTPEFLVIAAIEALAKEECHFMTFGPIPGNALIEISGLSIVSAWVVRILFRITNRFFHLENKRTFWEKFHPTSKQSYVLFEQPRIGLKEIRALTRVLNIR